MPRASDSLSGDGVRLLSPAVAFRSTIWMCSSRGVLGLLTGPLDPSLALLCAPKWPSRSGTDVGEFRARLFPDFVAPLLKGRYTMVKAVRDSVFIIIILQKQIL